MKSWNFFDERSLEKVLPAAHTSHTPLSLRALLDRKTLCLPAVGEPACSLGPHSVLVSKWKTLLPHFLGRGGGRKSLPPFSKPLSANCLPRNSQKASRDSSSPLSACQLLGALRPIGSTFAGRWPAQPACSPRPKNVLPASRWPNSHAFLVRIPFNSKWKRLLLFFFGRGRGALSAPRNSQKASRDSSSSKPLSACQPLSQHRSVGKTFGRVC